jgi:ABC-2 type transport system permease protein
MRQLRSYSFWWALALALFIIMILPSYVSMLAGGAVDMEALEGNPMFDMFGVDAHVIGTPIGCYGFINAFLAIAGGINGMFLGLKAFTKETVQNTADYIYTKPYKRGTIFCSKLISSFISVSIIGICYFLGSIAGGFAAVPGGFDLKLLALLTGSFFLIQLYFVLFGAFAGAVYSKIRTPLLLSSGVVFMLYVLSAFASKMDSTFIKFFSPFSYFGASKIINSGGYNASFMLSYIIFCAIFTVAGYVIFIKKDVQFIS